MEPVSEIQEAPGVTGADARRAGAAGEPAARCFHERFARQARRTPDALALVHGGEALTYAALDTGANRLAHALRAHGVMPEARVAVSLERGPRAIAAILAVLKAGGAYVPLDPAYPRERLAWMLADCGASLLLADAGLADALPAGPWRVLRMDALEAGSARHPADAPAVPADPDHLAYVIYTSGSTGRPKGVMVSHRGIAGLAATHAASLGVDAGSRVLQFAPLGFDASVWEMAMAFLAGAALVLAPRDRLLPGPALLALLRDARITHATLPPSVLGLLPDDALPDLRVLVAAGEASTPALVDRWAPGRRFFNAYGPTETTVCATMGACAAGEPVTIGGAIVGARVHVLDDGLRPVAPGATGELFVGGDGLARGYHGRAALTAERFVPDPFGAHPGARLYRTGDVVRARADGRLEYVGRADQQVKVRGHRVEPGEVEAVLQASPAVAAAVVTAYTAADGLATLCAHVVPANGALDDGELRAWAAARLPGYMVPSRIVHVPGIPLTPNGKADRARLPHPDSVAAPARGRAPRTETERRLARIWGEVLGMDAVGVDQPFLELGGHSLRAVRVLARIADAFGAALPPDALLRSGTIEEVARLLDDGTAARVADGAPALVSVPRDGPLPLSFAQEATWFFEQFAPGLMAYRAQATLRIRGPLDIPVLERALTEIVRRHEIFRTTFPEEDGGPVQRIHPPWTVRLPVHEAAGADEAAREASVAALVMREFLTPFDVTALPLVWWSLVRVSAEDHVFTIVEHHFVHDGWSAGVFLRDLSALYTAFREGRPSPLADPPVQFADFAVWQRRWMETDAAREKLRYWERALAGVPTLSLPTDFPRPAVLRFRGERERVPLAPALAAEARAFSRARGVTFFVTLLAAFQALMGRYAGQRDFAVGSGLGNRGHVALEDVIGMVVNTVALRADLDGDPTGEELLRRVRATTLRAYAHQDVPFDQVVRRIQPERSSSALPVYQVSFSFHDSHLASLSFGGLRLEVEEALNNGSAKFDLQVTVVPRAEQGIAERRDEVVMIWEYSTDLFQRETVRRMIGHYERLLAQLVRAPERPVWSLDLLGDDERARVLDGWSGAARAHPAGPPVHEAFAARAARAPDAPALAWGDDVRTYGALDADANRLARHLRRHGVGPETRVGVYLERGPALVTALLAVLKAGGAYVPLDPAYPAERLAFMLGDAGVAVLVTQASLRGGVTVPAGVPVVDVDDARDAIAAASAAPVDGGAGPGHLAYVLYTSGSTGTPKGVAVEHGGLSNLCAWYADAFSLLPADRVTQLASPGFDASGFEVWPCLSRGACLDLVPHAPRTDPPRLRDWLVARGATLAFAPTPVAEALLALPWPADAPLRWLHAGGDRLQARPPAGAPFSLSNNYGPTECTIVAVAAVVEAEAPGLPSIGTPVHNTPCYVLDGGMQPLPAGVPGELYVGGVQVARGYLGRPALTAASFVPDPFSRVPGARLYRTGDRARWRADGTLDCLGRLDAQVKIRGFRIEPGEVEGVLRRHPAVRDAVVLVREDAPGGRRLVAWTVGTADGDALRAWVRDALPEYMVPAAFVPVDSIPLTPNGKPDRRALPAPAWTAEADFVAPRTPAEEVLAGIWAEVLRVDRVGATDDFFALGGHSLVATRMVSRVREAFAAEVPLRVLFESPTVAGLARAVEDIRRADRPVPPPVVPVARGDAAPLSFAQERLWFLDRLAPGDPSYTIARALRLDGALDVDALRRALGEIVRRHEALRTTFREVDGAPAQVVHPFAGFTLPVEEVPADGDPEAAVQGRAAAEAARPFDLGAGPLFRPLLLRVDAESHVLLLCMHHVVGDEWSMGVLFRELAALYEAYETGAGRPLPPLPVQYADFAAWQRARLRDAALEGQLAYWRDRLAGAPPLLPLPADRPRPAVRSPRGAREFFALPEGLAERLEALGRREGATLFMVLVGAWQVLLSRYGGGEDVVVGTPVAGRTRGETEGLIGFFSNTLVLRTDLSGDPAFREVLRRVRETTLGAYDHQEVPFERLVAELRPERSQGHAPLFQVLFGLENADRAAPALPGLALTPVDVPRDTVKYDLVLTLVLRPGGMRGALAYGTDLFDRATIQRMTGHLARVLEQVAEDADRRLSELELATEEERRLVLHAWNGAAEDAPAPGLVPARFAAQVARTPDAPALVFRGAGTTYAELDARANRLAHHLRRGGVGLDGRVGICLERGPDLVVAVLAVLKAGAAYVPLDPGAPAERMARMLADAGAAVLLASGDVIPPIPGDVRVVRMDADAAEIDREPATAPDVAVMPENLAYVIYTSGSTGTPKGVGVTHGGLARYLAWFDAAVLGAEGFALPMVSRVSFDAHARQLFPPLLRGEPAWVLPEEAAADPVALLHALAARGGRVSFGGVPSLWAALVERMRAGDAPRPDGLVAVLLGGETLPAALAEQTFALFPDVALWNHYGPTEATVNTSVARVRPGAPVGIGRPVAGARVYLLDGHGRPAPVGVPGELHVGGPGVARGYLGRPGLTAERFVPDPFASTPGARMYRSGDRVRWRADGELVFAGRVDFQVKVRGFRVEPGEVEAALRGLDGVRDCVVVAREDAPGEWRLVAYVVGGGAVDGLRDGLRRTLPEPMVPSAFVRLDALPLTPRGKVDRRALPPPDAGPADDDYVPPRTPTEARLAALWAEVLRAERVGIHDPFFEIGGHSLLAMRAVARVREAFGVELPLRALFAASTVARLAPRIDQLVLQRLDDGDLADAFAQLDGLSDAEVAALLDAAGGAEGP